MFEFLSYNQFLEIRATSKEIMLFHDNGFVLLRLAGDLTNNLLLPVVAMLWLTGKLDIYSTWPHVCATNIFFAFSLFVLGDEFLTKHIVIKNFIEIHIAYVIKIFENTGDFHQIS